MLPFKEIPIKEMFCFRRFNGYASMLKTDKEGAICVSRDKLNIDLYQYKKFCPNQLVSKTVN